MTSYENLMKIRNFSRYLYDEDIKNKLSKLINEHSKYTEEQSEYDNEIDAIMKQISQLHYTKYNMKELYSKKRKLLEALKKNQKDLDEYINNSKIYFVSIFCLLVFYTNRFKGFCKTLNLKRSVDSCDNKSFLKFFSKDFFILKESLKDILRKIILDRSEHIQDLRSNSLGAQNIDSLSFIFEILHKSLRIDEDLIILGSQHEHLVETQIIAILEAYNRYSGKDNQITIPTLFEIRERQTI